MAQWELYDDKDAEEIRTLMKELKKIGGPYKRARDRAEELRLAGTPKAIRLAELGAPQGLIAELFGVSRETQRQTELKAGVKRPDARKRAA